MSLLRQPAGGGLIAAGAILATLSVAAGAFGAHGLREQLDVRALEQWETAARYLIYAGFGTMVCGLLGGSRARLAAWFLVVGGAVFALAVGGLALGAPRFLGAVAPLGGLSMIAGFALLALAARQGSANA